MRNQTIVPITAVLGGAALVAQTLLVRELMVSFYGAELALAAVLSCWLLFIPLGAFAGVCLLKRVRGRLWPLWLALIGIALGLVVEFTAARLARLWLGAQAGQFLQVSSMLLAAAGCAAPVAFWVGFYFPLAARWEEDRGGLAAFGISRAYVAEAVGSGAAGALLSFYLLSRLCPTALAFAACVLLLSVSVWFFAGRRWWACAGAALGAAGLLCASARLGHVGFFLLPVVALGAAGLFGPHEPRHASSAWMASTCLALAACLALTYLVAGKTIAERTERARWRTFSRFELRDSRDSRYQHLNLGERQGIYVLTRDGVRADLFPDTIESQKLAALLLTQHPLPRHALVIGGGLGGLCQAMLSGPVDRLDYVEPDPALFSLLWEYLPAGLRRPLDDPRFTGYRCDGRYFVDRCRERGAELARFAWRRPGGKAPAAGYDLVVINVGDPTSAAGGRFYTVEFYRELLKALRPGGVVAVCGITGGQNYLDESRAVLRYAASHYRTITSVFDRVVVRPGDELCFFTGEAATTAPEVLKKRFAAQGLGPEGLEYSFELEQFPPGRVRWTTDLLVAAAPSAALNTDVKPILFTLYMAVQKYYRRGAGAPGRSPDFFTVIRSIPRPWFWAPFGLLPAVVLLVRRLRGAGGAAVCACGLAVFTTGMFGLSAEMLLVYRYQTTFGFVYRDISIIVGMFMAGLAL
ncbi:MAG: hypothetical protein J7M08_10185, partial [Planctomycetes bacterium]|nr:hypothetical protein [Planctomycetota bacterium]